MVVKLAQPLLCAFYAWGYNNLEVGSERRGTILFIFITLIIAMILTAALVATEAFRIDDDIQVIFHLLNPKMAIMEEDSKTEGVKIMVFPVFETKSI